jgi:Ser/Thr protein kinase RdoA (MazF antagonist)
MRGQKIAQRLRLAHFAALGRLMARLHEHVAHWQLPDSFQRRHWDWDGLFGDNAGFHLPASEVWALLSPPYDEQFGVVAEQIRRVMEELGQGREAFGLLHADLSVGQEGNVLFAGGEARPIDFDDCGYGYWIYDLAVALAHWRLAESWPRIRDALLAGYHQVRVLPDEQLAYLELFMAARHVSEILWAVDMAQVNPRMEEELDGWIEWAGRNVKRYLDDH